MSTRFYPRFVKGNPQLRIFLPDWKMVMVKTKEKLPENVVTFKIDPRMTDWDVRNYLEKIYKVKVGAVRSRILTGKLKTVPGGLAKGDDYRLAHVTLSIGETFKWPKLFPKEKQKEDEDEFKKTKEKLDEGRAKDPNVQEIPTWFL